ncbi:FAD-binding oxidoreductase [Albidovulum sediminicola]|uniref:FAD-binding oxidoreductase n=1 Tax=Albidovulum sediminicola TaxID=2984331 RepID=A0ABT2Z789_9RHOB|nr:FAD-binding oxidoreductase [Defluviimonas sp. WL0075]MCV2866641.1 FAD-binding oxidoreductase [Defluviimonas sp. WL0075]
MAHDILKARIRGTVITRFDPNHAAASDELVWNGRKPERRAQLIVRAANVRDVQEAVRYASEHGLTVSARGGGHQFTGIAARADMVIDLGALDSLRIDVEARTAELGPAVTNIRLASALERHVLGFPTGHCGDVTVSGYLLGGGVGWNSSAWGIACFSVFELDVVMADGQLLTVNQDSHPEIFWAARGAGPAFFGIVTAFRVHLYEGPKAANSLVRVYPASAAEVVADWAERAVARSPAHVEFTVKIDQTPDGAILAAIANIFAVDPADAEAIGVDLWHDAPAGTLELAGPMPTPIPSLYAMTAASTPTGSRYGVDALWSEGSFSEALSASLLAIQSAPSPQSFGLVSLRSNAEPLPDTAAFSVTGRVFSILYGIWAEAEQDELNLTWLREAVARFRSFATGTYVGEADLDRPGPSIPTLSDPSAARLAELSRRYDPHARFASASLTLHRSAA